MSNMIEKVSPEHPDKVADRIAGAIVDLAYKKNENPKVAVEVLIGHGVCHVIAETSETFTNEEVDELLNGILKFYKEFVMEFPKYKASDFEEE